MHESLRVFVGVFCKQQDRVPTVPDSPSEHALFRSDADGELGQQGRFRRAPNAGQQVRATAEQQTLLAGIDDPVRRQVLRARPERVERLGHS